ncbi:MAG TPA: fumarylacetoacetate hydrolase family protein [Ottowia sp.]|nr:fumarylacetoacetate hydrolase family protein [Ottowia sp.]
MNFDPPWLPGGTVYGTLLNFRREFDLWAPKMAQAPYQAAPKAPVLYVKTANTFAPRGAAVPVPGEVEIGATLGLVIGSFESNEAVASASQAQSAINHEVDVLARVAGCVLIDDLSLPHASYYRPAIRWRNRDGFLVCAPAVTPLREIDIKALKIEVRVNGAWVQTVDLSTLMRDAATLLADVSAFMTLQPGDVLLLGTDCLADGTRPRARAGDRVEISAPGLATLTHTLAAEVSAVRPPQGAKAPSGGSADTPVRSVGAYSS